MCKNLDSEINKNAYMKEYISGVRAYMNQLGISAEIQQQIVDLLCSHKILAPAEFQNMYARDKKTLIVIFNSILNNMKLSTAVVDATKKLCDQIMEKIEADYERNMEFLRAS
jgi:hypothetical protein